MKRQYNFCVTLAAVICICTGGGCELHAQKSAGEVIKNMQNIYKNLKDFESSFLQIEEWDLAGTVDTVQGRMAHLKDDFFKIETDNITIMTDGKKVWDYNIFEEQLVIDYLDKDDKDSFLLNNYLFDFPKRFSTVDFIPEKRNGADGFFISLEPKNPDEEWIVALEVWIDAADFVVKMARYTDYNDNVIIFILEDFKGNVGLKPEAFKLTIPEGKKVKTIDLTKGN